MLKGLEVNVVAFPEEVVAPWAREFFAEHDEELTEGDVEKMKETLEYDKIVLSKPSTYDDIERELSSKKKVPLSLIAFDVLTDSEYLSENGFFFMERLEHGDEQEAIFHVKNGRLQAFDLAKGYMFPAGTVIRALKKK